MGADTSNGRRAAFSKHGFEQGETPWWPGGEKQNCVLGSHSTDAHAMPKRDDSRSTNVPCCSMGGYAGPTRHVKSRVGYAMTTKTDQTVGCQAIGDWHHSGDWNDQNPGLQSTAGPNSFVAPFVQVREPAVHWTENPMQSEPSCGCQRCLVHSVHRAQNPDGTESFLYGHCCLTFFWQSHRP